MVLLKQRMFGILTMHFLMREKGKRLLWCLDVLIVLGAWWEFQEFLLDLTMGRMGDGAIS